MSNSRKTRSTKKNTEIHELRKENAALKKEIASLKPPYEIELETKYLAVKVLPIEIEDTIL